jgi:hypothetical protein
MSGKRAKQLRQRAYQMILDMKNKHNKEIELFSSQIKGEGEPNLMRKIKKDYIAGRIDKQLNPIGV